MSLVLASLACLLTACTYVGLLYIWRGSLPRDHAVTIKRRFLSTGLACCLSWIPVYLWAVHYRQVETPVWRLLGLRGQGLAQAVCDSLYLNATLFAGPLLYYLHSLEVPRSVAPPPRSRAPPPASAPPPPPPATHTQSASGDGLGGGGNGHGPGEGLRQRRVGERGKDLGTKAAGGGEEEGADGQAPGGGWVVVRGFKEAARWGAAAVGRVDLRTVRNLVVAPLTEEWVFRACMVPLLKMEGLSNLAVVFLTPLFFGAAHLHHVGEMVRHQGVGLGRALAAVAFQFAYTTVFGWLATYLFLRTGHVAAPLAAHALCNWAGFPPFADMADHPRGPLLLVVTAGGAAAFAVMLHRMTAPGNYGQDFYTW